MNMHVGASIDFKGVRLANRGDFEAIYSLLEILHAENGMFRMDPVKVREQLDLMFSERNPGFIGVIDGEKGLEASIGMVMDTWWYTSQFALNERWNFVHPDHRKTTHAKRLLEFSKWVSECIGVPVLMGIISTERTEAKIRLLRRQMGEPIGAFFSYGFAARSERDI